MRELLDRVRLPAATPIATPPSSPAASASGWRSHARSGRTPLLICDEVTSALDVSVQAATLELLGELQRDLGLALLFITHDLGVVASVADRILVMESGVVCERGLVEAVLARPQEPYTRRLIAAAPSLTADVEAQRSDLPAGAEFRG